MRVSLLEAAGLCLLFADYLVLLALFGLGLQHALYWFSAACQKISFQAEMKIFAKKQRHYVSPKTQANVHFK